MVFSAYIVYVMKYYLKGRKQQIFNRFFFKQDFVFVVIS